MDYNNIDVDKIVDEVYTAEAVEKNPRCSRFVSFAAIV